MPTKLVSFFFFSFEMLQFVLFLSSKGVTKYKTFQWNTFRADDLKFSDWRCTHITCMVKQIEPFLT